MHQIRFRLGLRPRPRWGSLQRSPRLPSWIKRVLLLRGRGGERRGGEGEEGKGRGGEEREGRGKKGRAKEGGKEKEGEGREEALLVM